MKARYARRIRMGIMLARGRQDAYTGSLLHLLLDGCSTLLFRAYERTRIWGLL